MFYGVARLTGQGDLIQLATLPRRRFAKPEDEAMLIKQSPHYELEVSLTPYEKEFSLVMQQRWPGAQKPYWRNIAQVMLSDDEIERLLQLLMARKSDRSEPLLSISATNAAEGCQS